MVDRYVSSKTVIAKLYRDLGINTEINESDVIEWIAEVLDKIGTFSQYGQYKECLEITSGKVLLPPNFYKLVDLSFNNQKVSWSNVSMYTSYACDGCTIPTCCTDYHFYIQGNYIITDIPDSDVNYEGEHTLCVIYLGVVVDSDGYPMIPDDVYFLEACSKYVTYMLDQKEWRKGHLPDKIVNKSETDYLWAVGAAKGSGNMPNKEKLEVLKNVWVRLIPRMNGLDINPERKINH